MLDSAVFKRLSHNDTGLAVGHQGGIVVPKDISQFFPALTRGNSASNPTTSVSLQADLLIEGTFVGSAVVRYQHQTWGGTRSPERRLTDNLGPIRLESREGDFIVFRKDLSNDGFLQLNLLRQGSAEHANLLLKVGNLRWGVVEKFDPPVSLSEFEKAEESINEALLGEPTAFFEDRAEYQVVSMRKARDRAFRLKLLEQYGYACTFTGRKLVSPISPQIMGLDAAHVVPVFRTGSDHPANGLVLTKELHWAFDRGLIGVDANRQILVPNSVGVLKGNEFLASLHGEPIREASSLKCRVLDEALAWHRTNTLLA
jgi:putative restriction endonuclease